MKTPSAKILSAEPSRAAAFDPAPAARLTGFKRLFWKIDRVLTAVAHAETGDLDAMQEIRDQDLAVAQLRQARQGAGRAPLDMGLHGAKAI